MDLAENPCPGASLDVSKCPSLAQLDIVCVERLDSTGQERRKHSAGKLTCEQIAV